MPIAISTALVASLLIPSPLDPGLEYRISISAESPRTAEVELVVPDGTGVLRMSDLGATHREDGWAAFVEGVTASDAIGRDLTVNKTAGREWRIEPGAPPIRIRYRVELTHDSEEWPGGVDGAAYATAWGVFYTGRALFAVPEESSGPIRVVFDLPENWRVSTPWVGDGESGFLVRDATTLTESILFAGEHELGVVERDGFEIRVAMGGESVRAGREAILARVREVFDYYVDLMGDAPRPPPGQEIPRILVVLNESSVTDGEVVGSHISMLLEPDPDPQAAMFAELMFPHEFFHLWNGTSIRRDGPEDWFSEGFTNLYMLKAALRSGSIDERGAFAVLDGLLYRRYRADEGTGRISMREAVSAKDEHWGLIYGGGAFVAICQDVEIRRRTGNRKSVDDLMRAMFERFGGGTDGYDLEDVSALASSISGTDQSDFYDRHVRGSEPVPIADCLRRAGLEVGTEDGGLRISRSPDALPMETAIVDGLLGVGAR